MVGRYLMLADYAEFTPNGRLSLIGGDLERFSFSQLPGLTPPFMIVAKIHLDLTEKDVFHLLTLIISDPDHEPISDQLRATILPATTPYKSTSAYAGIPVRLSHPPMEVLKSGKYSVELFVDSKPLLQTYFHVFAVTDLKPADFGEAQ